MPRASFGSSGGIGCASEGSRLAYCRAAHSATAKLTGKYFGALLDALDPTGSLISAAAGGGDLIHLTEQGNCPTGLGGAGAFVHLAREHSVRPVLHQDFLSLDLPAEAFDGVFANACLFQVPGLELPRVLQELLESLRLWGVLFASNAQRQ